MRGREAGEGEKGGVEFLTLFLLFVLDSRRSPTTAIRVSSYSSNSLLLTHNYEKISMYVFMWFVYGMVCMLVQTGFVCVYVDVYVYVVYV